MKDFYVILFNTRDFDVKFLKNEGFYDKLCNEFKSYRIMNINLMGFFFFFFSADEIAGRKFYNPHRIKSVLNSDRIWRLGSPCCEPGPFQDLIV